MLEAFLYDEGHAFDGGSGLAAEVYDAEAGIAVGQEVIDEENVVFGGEVFLADDDGVVSLLGERTHRRDKHVIHCRGFLLFGKHNGQFHEVSQHDGRCYARGLDGQYLVDGRIGEAPYELYGYLLHQVRVHLVVDEAVHLQYAATVAAAVFQYSFT